MKIRRVSDAPGRTRTSDQQLRRLLLYPPELRAPIRARKSAVNLETPRTRRKPGTATAMSRLVFVTGGTGYMGQRLIAALLGRGHDVRALVRGAGARKLPEGTAAIHGDALDHTTYDTHVAPADTFVHLVGISHPSPAKAPLFRSVDLASVREALTAATGAAVEHFVYVSVAQPAPIMQSYVQARADAELLIRQSGLNATILRPWYVLGPGHWWPVGLLPAYWVAALLPPTRDSARRLGLVTLGSMMRTLVAAIEDPAQGLRILGVPQIRRGRL